MGLVSILQIQNSAWVEMGHSLLTPYKTVNFAQCWVQQTQGQYLGVWDGGLKGCDHLGH